MRKALLLFLLATAWLYHNGEPFDQRPLAVASVPAPVSARTQLLPAAGRHVAGVASFGAAQPFAAGFSQPDNQRQLSQVKIAYRYALTDGERRATNGFLSRMIKAVRPAPNPRLVTDTRGDTTSAYLLGGNGMPGFIASSVPAPRVASLDIAASSQPSVLPALSGGALSALAGEDLTLAEAGDATARC